MSNAEQQYQNDALGVEAIPEAGSTCPEILVSYVRKLVEDASSLHEEDIEARTIREMLEVSHKQDPKLDTTLREISGALFMLLKTKSMKRFILDEWQPLGAVSTALTATARDLNALLPRLGELMDIVRTRVDDVPLEEPIIVQLVNNVSLFPQRGQVAHVLRLIDDAQDIYHADANKMKLDSTLPELSKAIHLILQIPEFKEWLQQNNKWHPLCAVAMALTAPTRKLEILLPRVRELVNDICEHVGGEAPEADGRRGEAA